MHYYGSLSQMITYLYNIIYDLILFEIPVQKCIVGM